MTLVSLQEESRRAFEKMHLEYFPGINVTRKGEEYTKQQVNYRWFIWRLARGTRLPLPDTDMPPPGCRQRLMAEGKPYPRSNCSMCGVFSPKTIQCDQALRRKAP